MPWIRATVPISAVALTSALACGGPKQTSTSSPNAMTSSATQQVQDIAANSASTAYFHEQLVTNGEDVQTDFGSALLTLGMNPRDLQQDTPDHAYQTAKQKVDEVKDEALRRELGRALFGTAQAH